MIVETMSDLEIKDEILFDYNIIRTTSTISRFFDEYIFYRNKIKIKPNEEGILIKRFKTKNKNNWIILLKKKDFKFFTNENEDIAAYLYIQFNTSKGIRIAQPTTSNLILIYNGHLFTRYRERMNLNIVATKSIIEHFFSKNHEGYQLYFPKDENDEYKMITFSLDGYLLGTTKFLNEENAWLVHKTFIPYQLGSKKHSIGLDKFSYKIAIYILSCVNENQKIDDKTMLFANKIGIMKNNEIIVDLNEYIKQFPQEIIDDVNPEMYFV
jgi:hypothetical protein